MHSFELYKPPLTRPRKSAKNARPTHKKKLHFFVFCGGGGGGGGGGGAEERG